MRTDVLTACLPLFFPAFLAAASTPATERPPLTVHSVAVDAAGRVWLAGTVQGDVELRLQPGVMDTDFGILRTDVEGNPDPSFGTDGLARVHFGGDASGVVPTVNERACDLALVDGGAVVVGEAGGYGAPRLAVARVDGSGALVSSFGTAGLADRGWEKKSRATTVRLAPDGSLLVAGLHASGRSEAGDAAVVRFSASGTLDAGFGVGDHAPGAVLHRGYHDEVVDAEWVDGALWLLAGEKLRVARLTASGALDPAFGADGWFELEDDCHGWALAATPDGGAVVAGTVKTPADPRRPVFRFVKLTPDGKPDPAFGVRDWDPTVLLGEEREAQVGITRGLVADDAGGFLVYAEVTAGLGTAPYLFRFDASGAPDASWGDGGHQRVEQGLLSAMDAMFAPPGPHHMVRHGDRVVVADTLYVNDEVGNTSRIVWVEAFDL